jgi:hypothetical protein
MKRQSGKTAVLTCIYSFVTKSHPTAAAININRAESKRYKIIKIPYILTILSQAQIAENVVKNGCV